MIYLIEVDAYKKATGTVETLCYCKGQGFMTQPAETPPNAFYNPRVINPGFGRFDIFAKGSTGGESSISRGAVELVNVDGGLDYLTDYTLDGCRCTVRLGDNAAAYPAGFPVIETFTMAAPRFDQDKLSLMVRDRQADLDIPAQATLYAGTNVLPSGLEGVADLLGKQKPLPFGAVNNIAPPCVNTSRLIYETGAAVSNVYDSGNALTRGADYTTQTDMETTAPTAGQYRFWPGGNYFRLGASPVGQVTADVLQGSTAADRTAAQIIKQIATRTGGIAPADVSAADITALDTANSAVCGIWITTENRRTALDALCRTVGAWWGFDRTGIFRVQRLEIPAGTPVATLTTGIELDSVIQRDSETLPVWRVTVKYGRNYTVQTTGLAGAVADARRTWLKDEWSQVTASDSTIKTAHPLAGELTVETCFINQADAQTEANRLLALYGADRVRYSVRLLDPTKFAVMNLGAIISLVSKRYGLSAGKLFRIIGMQPDYGLGRVDLTLWG